MDSVSEPKRLPARVAAPLRQQVVELISEAIAAGTYKAGDRLVERDLCARYEVSRTVIREALRHIEALGLIEMVPNRGPVVATVSAAEAGWLYKVRAALEALAGESFALNATADQRSRLVSAVDDVAERLPASDMVVLLASKDRFYEVLLEGAHNPIIGSLLRTLHTRISLLRSVSLSAPGRSSHTLAELRGIQAAAVSGDAELAAKLCKQHVDNAAAVVLERLDAEARADAEKVSREGG